MKYKLFGNFSQLAGQGVLPFRYVFFTALICLGNVGSNALLLSFKTELQSTVFASFLAGKKDCVLLFTED